ncbi:MAG: class I adenylate cyclase, partial [Vibrio sp.]
WAFFNGLITESTHLDVLARQVNFDIDKLYQMVSALRNTFSIRKRLPTMQALSSPCEVDQLSIFINLEQDATEGLTTADVQVDKPHEVNVFQFGDEQRCLVSSIDLVFRNTWHEVRTLHFRGDDAMINALQRILGKMHQDALPPDSIDVFCYSKHFRALMRNTVFQLLSECIDLRLKPMLEERGQRYKVLDLAEHRYGLFFERRGVTVSRLDRGVDFYANISNKKLQNAPLDILDDIPQVKPPIVVDTYASEGLVQFFFEDDETGFNIYVLDENNQVEFYRQVDGTKDDVIRNINHFYATDTHTMNGEPVLNFNLPQYYQVILDDSGQQKIEPYRSDAV